MPCLRRRCLLCALSDLNEWRKVREAFLLSYNFYVPLGWPSRCFIVNNNAFYDGMIQRPQKGLLHVHWRTSLAWMTYLSVDCTMNIRVHIFVVFILSPTFTIVETTNAPRLMDVSRFQWEQAGIGKKTERKTRRNIFFFSSLNDCKLKSSSFHLYSANANTMDTIPRSLITNRC